MSAIALLLSMVSLHDAPCKQMPNPANWARSVYGEKLEFIINRNNKPVGQHVVEFDQTDELAKVRSSTKIDIKFLFFTAYKFRLTANEYWTRNGLTRVESDTIDGSSKTELLKTFDNATNILPTSHWNPSVLNDDQVYNTITGKTNSVIIQPIGWEKVSTGTGPRNAYRYDYHGDLTDVSAWYDDQGRWVSLRFKARDGSMISYECVHCGI